MKINYKIMVHPFFEKNPFGEDFIPEDWEYKSHYQNKYDNNKWWMITSTNKCNVISETLSLIEEGKI